jgi:hypothetical protein
MEDNMSAAECAQLSNSELEEKAREIIGRCGSRSTADANQMLKKELGYSIGAYITWHEDGRFQALMPGNHRSSPVVMFEGRVA